MVSHNARFKMVINILLALAVTLRPAIALTTTSSSSSATSVAPTIVPTAGPFKYIGCYTDNDINNRALQGAGYLSNSSTTVENCEYLCSSYQYFGVEYGQVCRRVPYCCSILRFHHTLEAIHEKDKLMLVLLTGMLLWKCTLEWSSTGEPG